MDTPLYHLEVFDGPLDLLLSLIAKNKVDVYDIPIALILDQYMEYIDRMHDMNMEVAGEFIVMASELMLIKSRMLLPKPPSEEEEDPRAALARALVEYQRAKAAAVYLGEQYQNFAGRIIKEPDVLDKTLDPPVDLEIELLSKAMDRILARNRDIPRMAKESERAIGQLIKERVVPVSEKIIGVMRELRRKGSVAFEELMLSSKNRSDLIAAFSAVLELVRAQRITLAETEDGDVILTLSTEHTGRRAVV